MSGQVTLGRDVRDEKGEKRTHAADDEGQAEPGGLVAAPASCHEQGRVEEEEEGEEARVNAGRGRRVAAGEGVVAAVVLSHVLVSLLVRSTFEKGLCIGRYGNRK